MADTSLEFLKWLRPKGTWVLTAIVPDGAIITRTFRSDQEKGVLAWLSQHNKRNIYFQVNSSGQSILQKKASKNDISEAEFLHVDVDPDSKLEFEISRQEIFNRLTEYTFQPSFIIDSGGGYQAFWRLDVPTKDLNLAERCNLQIARELGGDHCHNIDRIMRLPGTTNWPDRRKKKKGRIPAPAELSYESTTEYSIDRFVPAPLSEGDEKPILTLEEPVNLEDVGVDDEVVGLIRTGQMEGREWNSRSEAVWFVMCELVRKKVSPEAIIQIMLNKDYQISSHFHDQTDPMGSALKQVRRALDYAVHPDLMKMNEEYFTVFIGGKFRVVRDRGDTQFMEVGSFEKHYSNQSIRVGDDANGNPLYKKKGKWWIEHPDRRSYMNMIFDPEAQPSPEQYNTWLGFSEKALPGTKHEKYLEHILSNICNGVQIHFEYVIGWLSRLIQNPASQSETALVLKGKEGTGKNSFVQPLGWLFPEHFFETPNASHFVGNFNFHLHNKILVHANEAFYAGDRRHEAMLKMLITEPTIAIERKGVDVQQSPNYVHLIMSSNSDWVVPAGPDARRFFILEISDKQKNKEQYFAQMKKDLHDGGLAHLLHFLYTYDLSEYHVRAFPQTSALTRQRIHTMGKTEQWWMHCLDREHITINDTNWDNEIYVEDVWTEFCQEENKNSRISRIEFGHAINRFVPNLRKVRRQIEGQKRYMYVFPTLQECRDHFDKERGGPYPWGTLT